MEHTNDIKKTTRKLTAYNLFFKEQMVVLKFSQLAPNEKMKHIAKLWAIKKKCFSENIGDKNAVQV
jgi:hypothetical protein